MVVPAKTVDSGATSEIVCALCEAPMEPDVAPDTFHCTNCDYFVSKFPVRINEVERIDEAARERALKPIRLANFRQLLNECADLLPKGTTLLDVGCAHGWFMEAATSRGLTCYGIEPDLEMAQRARSTGHEVIAGFFPDAMPTRLRFNAITFNDVFEHLPDVTGIVRSLPGYLVPGGIVIVNLPVASGPIFRIVRAVARFGIIGPLDRMWQTGLPSPHLSYFKAPALLLFFERSGFDLVRCGELQSVGLDGLYDRIRYDRSIGRIGAAVMYIIAIGAYLVSKVFSSDIQYFVFRQKNK